MNPAITSSEVITSVLAYHPGESLLRVAEACAMVEKACSDPALALGRHFQTMVFTLAIEMSSLLDPDAIAIALLYHLPSLTTGVSREALDRLLNLPTQDTRSTLVRDLMRFSGMEWN